MPQTTQDKRGLWTPNYDGSVGTLYPDGSKPSRRKIIITGTGFGTGPNVILFDQFIGEHLADVSLVADVGTWDAVSSYGSGTPKLWYDAATGRTWLAGRDPLDLGGYAKNLQALFKSFGNHAEFRMSHRAYVPSAYNFPGATTPGVFPTTSSWKYTWNGKGNGGSDLIGTAIPYRNVCIPSHVGNGSMALGGNSNAPKHATGAGVVYAGWSFNQPTFYSWYQSGAGVHNEYTEIGEMTTINDATATVQELMIDPFGSSSADSEFTGRDYDAVRFPGWFGGGPSIPEAVEGDYRNVLPLENDFYYAVGPGSRAMVVVNAATTHPVAGVTFQPVPDVWTDTRIEFEIADHIQFDSMHVHIKKADGTNIYNVAYTEEIV